MSYKERGDEATPWRTQKQDGVRYPFNKFDHLMWDEQIEADSKSGKLDRLIDEALVDFKAGKAREI